MAKFEGRRLGKALKFAKISQTTASRIMQHNRAGKLTEAEQRTIAGALRKLKANERMEAMPKNQAQRTLNALYPNGGFGKKKKATAQKKPTGKKRVVQVKAHTRKAPRRS